MTIKIKEKGDSLLSNIRVSVHILIKKSYICMIEFSLYNTDMRNLVFILLGYFLYSCSAFIPEPDMDLRLKSQKLGIDTCIANGEASSLSVTTLNKDQEIHTFFQLFQNGANNLIKASETYVLDDIPSDTTYVYYFDNNERIFAFQVKIAIHSDSIYNSATAFYDSDMQVITKEFATIDNCDIPIGKNDSLLIDFSQFKIPNDITGFVKEKKIILRNR